MQIAGTKLLNDSTISFDVFLKSTDSSFQLTSYQCILCLNNNNPVYQFSYLEGSSQLNNMIPQIGVGVINLDGEIKLTFASLPGNEVITTNELKIGSFVMKTHIDSKLSMPIINWCFNEKISTILTGKSFQDITNDKDHSSLNNGQILVQKIVASSTDSSASTDFLTDGKMKSEVDINSNWKTDRMPAYLIFDLGNEINISRTRFSFNNWDKGRIYQYSIYTSDDNNSWNEVVSNVSSSAEEWTVNNFSNQNARYIKLLIISNNQNEWATLWEIQIFGTNEITDVNDKDNVKIDKPHEFALSQNYPNPFNPTTKINFVLAEPGRVNLEVYNILGEKVSTLVDQDMGAGSHEANFNATNLASGIYIYRLNVQNKFIDTKKMILMK